MSCSRCVLFQVPKKGHFYKVYREPRVDSKSKCSTAVLVEIKDEFLRDAHSKLNIPVSINGVEASCRHRAGSILSHLSDRL